MKKEEEIINEVLDKLGDIYPKGLYRHLFDKNKGLYNEINKLEEDIHVAFLNKNTEELKIVLRKYWLLHIKGIEIYNENLSSVNIDVSEGNCGDRIQVS